MIYWKLPMILNRKQKKQFMVTAETLDVNTHLKALQNDIQHTSGGFPMRDEYEGWSGVGEGIGCEEIDWDLFVNKTGFKYK